MSGEAIGHGGVSFGEGVALINIENWENVRLIDVAEIVMGQSPPSSTYNKSGDGLPFFQGTKDFNYRRPSPRVFCSAPSRVAQPEDILFSVRAPIGRVNVANRECAIGRGLAAIKPRNQADARFLEFSLRHRESSWDRIEGGGSVFGNATRKDIEELVLFWPQRKEERHVIAQVLGTLDDKIELNRRMNETLEEMARTLFKSWFVDFDPVRAKMENRDTGLPKHIADLFPDRLVESELGQIPKGWKIHSLGDVVEAVKGCSYKSQELAESNTALITLKSFARGGGYRPGGLKEFVGKYKPDQVVRPGEIVISCTDITQAAEVVGRPAIVPAIPAYRTLVASLDVLIVRPNQESITCTFLYFLAGNARFAAHAYAYATGTTVLHLSKEVIPSFRFACSPPVVQAFDDFVNPLLIRTQKTQPESDLLESLRETLLPRLISGQIRIRDRTSLNMAG